MHPTTTRLVVIALGLGAAWLASDVQAQSAHDTASGWRQSGRGLPLISTFDLPPTRHNGEVWSFASAEHGRIWIGSDELFLFDGKAREKIDLPVDTYAVRALAHDAAGRLWIGAIGEIGHLEPTPTGGWRYVSAREDIQAAGVDDLRDIWRGFGTPEGVVFVADQQVLRVTDHRIERWRLPTPFSTLLGSEDGENLWIFQGDVGLLRMARGGPELALPMADLPASVVFWALTPESIQPFAAGTPSLLGTVDGVFARQDGSWIRLPNLSAALAGKLPLHATMIDPQSVVVGSYLGGLVIASLDDQVLAVLDRTSGLPHDTITGVWFDRAGFVWAGYPGGLARIEASGAVSLFETRNGVNDPVLKVLPHRGETFVLTRRQLSRLAPGRAGRPATAVPAAILQIPLSDAISVGDELLFSGYGGGIWRLVDNQPQSVAAAPGFIFGLQAGQHVPQTLLVLRNTTIEELALTNTGDVATQASSADLGAYPLNMVRDALGDIWVATVTRGVFRFRPSPGAAGSSPLTLVKHYREGDGLPSATQRPRLAAVGGRVFVLSEREILTYDASGDRFVAEPAFRPWIGVAATTSSDPAVAYWLVRENRDNAAAPVLIRVRVDDRETSPTWEAIHTPDFDQAGSIAGLSTTDTDGGSLWLAGSRATVRLSLPNLGAPPPMPRLAIQRIRRNEHDLSLPSPGAELRLAPDTTRLSIELAGVARASGNTVYAQASLGGLSDAWMAPQEEPTFSFTGLRPGRYTFRARSVDPFGRTGAEATLLFTLEAPWYQRAPAIAGYVLAGLLLVFGGVRWRLRHLRRQNERLNRIVDERTRELAHSNVVKNEFLENISHEIRNPLNGIANLVDLLRDAPLQTEERRLAQSLGRSTEHLKRVFSDVLGYTKLEYGHVQVDAAPFSLLQLLEDVVALFGVEAREHKTELTLRPAGDFADGFRGDAEKVRTIVGNYVSNALKYAPGAPVEIEVRSQPGDDAAHALVWIGVRDHGPGLSTEEQAKLFQKFSRGDRAKAQGVSGTGLGLALCRGLAELMEGSAGVISEPGRGSTFWLELPLERASRPAPAAVATHGSDDQAGPAHALIVDDQEYNQAVLRGIARRLGFAADVASHAGEVWPLIERHTYSTVFLDWELPGMNGGEIARRLRAHPHTRDAVIIATTAHDTDDIRQRCLEAQMDGFALKPFDTTRLRRILETAVSRRAGRSSPASAAEETSAPTPGASEAGLNLSAFGDFAVGDPAHARQAVSLYLAALDDELTSLRASLASADREAVARRAHRLRSHASLVNGIALSTAAQHLVAAARDPSVSDWQAHAPGVFAAAEALRTAISSLAASPSADA
ncbi:MAG: response regulator [Opitutaceae bacterium]|nr:response regulator [Opitutaceae bacterium]